MVARAVSMVLSVSTALAVSTAKEIAREAYQREMSARVVLAAKEMVREACRKGEKVVMVAPRTAKRELTDLFNILPSHFFICFSFSNVGRNSSNQIVIVRVHRNAP